jgi:hypothetical protein
MAEISARYGERDRISQRRVTASKAGIIGRTAGGSHDRQSSRKARACAAASMAWHSGPPSRMSRSGMVVRSIAMSSISAMMV